MAGAHLSSLLTVVSHFHFSLMQEERLIQRGKKRSVWGSACSALGWQSSLSWVLAYPHSCLFTSHDLPRAGPAPTDGACVCPVPLVHGRGSSVQWLKSSAHHILQHSSVIPELTRSSSSVWPQCLSLKWSWIQNRGTKGRKNCSSLDLQQVRPELWR